MAKVRDLSWGSSYEKYAFFDIDGTIYDGFMINDFIDYHTVRKSEHWAGSFTRLRVGVSVVI